MKYGFFSLTAKNAKPISEFLVVGCFRAKRLDKFKIVRLYAWSHLDGVNDERTRFVAVLEIC
jgi:hypothetical protein